MKLTIELVPSSSWGNNIRAVFTNRQWNSLRGMVCDAAYNTCEICEQESEAPVECHEIWHYNEKTQIQTLTGMVCLCKDCHLVKHFGFARVSGKEKQALKHLMKVNKLDLPGAKKYIGEAFVAWRKRNQFNWTLDLTYLKKRYGIDVDKLKEPK